MADGSDLPPGFKLDPVAPSLPQGDALDDAAAGPTVAEILAAAENPLPLTPHEVYCEHMRAAIIGARPPGRSVLELNDTRAFVETWISPATGRALGPGATWIRIVRPDLGHGALFVMDCVHPCREAELTIVSDPRVISRAVIRDVCRWAFYGLRLLRVVLKIPADWPALSKMASKAKFKHEGTSRGFYGGTLDAEVWAMTGTDCPWLAYQRGPASSIKEPTHPLSRKVH